MATSIGASSTRRKRWKRNHIHETVHISTDIVVHLLLYFDAASCTRWPCARAFKLKSAFPTLLWTSVFYPIWDTHKLYHAETIRLQRGIYLSCAQFNTHSLVESLQVYHPVQVPGLRQCCGSAPVGEVKTVGIPSQIQEVWCCW